MKLTKVIVLSLLFLSASLSAHASRTAHQHKPRPVARELQAAPVVAHPAMWKVADSDTTIYLLGTVHALPKGLEWFDGTLATAFEQSQELVTEILEDDPAQMQSAVAAKAMLPKGQSLRMLMTPKKRRAFEAALRAQRMPVASLDPFKPWFAAVVLATQKVQSTGYDPNSGVEKVLGARAKALSRPHSALETAEYQLGLFDSLPQNVQLRYLDEVVRLMPSTRDELALMIDAWKRGDAKRLGELMNEEVDEPELVELLLINRNRQWATWIKTRLDKPGIVFVAVGAGHLAGKGSVQDQLAGKGVATTRVQ
jgi:uncharacterized protein